MYTSVRLGENRNRKRIRKEERNRKEEAAQGLARGPGPASPAPLARQAHSTLPSSLRTRPSWPNPASPWHPKEKTHARSLSHAWRTSGPPWTHLSSPSFLSLFDFLPSPQPCLPAVIQRPYAYLRCSPPEPAPRTSSMDASPRSVVRARRRQWSLELMGLNICYVHRQPSSPRSYLTSSLSGRKRTYTTNADGQGVLNDAL
jgi:hypothetical protein